MTGSPALWAAAELCGVVPIPPGPELARILDGWWQTPRRFGCVTARNIDTPWTVIWPDARIWCPDCATRRFETDPTCCYCGEPVHGGELLLFEVRATVRVLAWSHENCLERGG